jgi:anti-sigma B factor antagonist
MTLERTMLGSACVLTPKRNLTGGEETRLLAEAIDEVTASGVRKVVVDLGKISWANSMGLAGLQRARLLCNERDASLVLARVGTRIKNLLLTTRLVFLFDTFETIEEVVAERDEKSVSAS